MARFATARIGIVGETIAWVGAERDLPRDVSARSISRMRAAHGLRPGSIDCHTHLVYAGNRVDEFEARLNGATYADIARAGGGIKATVRATRAASDDELVAQSRPRLEALAAEGVTTVEIKSGYGLDTENECRQLRAARRVAARRRRRRPHDAARRARGARRSSPAAPTTTSISCAAKSFPRRRAKARRCGRRVLRDDRLHARRRRGASSRRRARTDCR